MRRRFPPQGGRSPRRRIRTLHHVPPLLRQANRLMEDKKYAEAAHILERVATRAAARRGTRAPLYYVRAGKAFILAGDTQRGMRRLRKGFRLIARRGDCGPLRQLSARTILSLQDMGLDKEAKEIETVLARINPDDCAEIELPEKRAQLPTQCPHCGAPLHPEQVVWLDGQNAECTFCGNLVRGED